MKEVYKRALDGTIFKVIQGDITQENVDAIVNAANGFLSHGGGVALAIVKAGGRIIQDESDAIVLARGPLKTGDAALTTGGKLKAKYVIHTVGPQWGEGNEEEKLRKAIISVLGIAKEHDFTSIAIPAVSCGIFGFPKDRGTLIIVKTVHDFIQSNKTGLQEVHFVGIGSEITGFFGKALKNA
jgi:O-acetyl-ADP-ribose deacetylase (regulator of RNase III)